MNPVTVGSTMNFAMPRRRKGGSGLDWEHMNHVCQVDVMEIAGNFPNFYYVCRRIDNGTPVFAYERELTPIER
jgi:hypothetical protein